MFLMSYILSLILGCTVVPRGIGIRGSGDPFFLSPDPPKPSTPPPLLRGAQSSRSSLREFFCLDFINYLHYSNTPVILEGAKATEGSLRK